MRDKQSEALVIEDVVEKVQGNWISRAEYDRLLDVLAKVVDALDQCVGIYGKLTGDLRKDIAKLRTK